jgi:uncharacterized protein
MKKWGLRLLALLVSCSDIGQKTTTATNNNSLLWEISGNGLQQPSYLFGTIHMLCKDDAVLSDSLRKIIRQSKDIYFEVDMDNLFEMIGLMTQMKMKNDTTLADLLDKDGYERVKKYFEKNSSMLPFSMLETYKPLLAVSTLAESAIPCESAVAMEQLIMEEAKRNNKNIKGLETMAFQAAIFDSIPYKLQAEQLLNYIDSSGTEGGSGSSEFEELSKAYQSQDLDKLEAFSKKNDIGISNFTEMLLYNRNRNWVEKLKTLLPAKALLIAVGAGHLPGEKGVINLLRKAGYTLKPVKNNMAKISREI